jgi:hemin uptake protein HemP
MATPELEAFSTGQGRYLVLDKTRPINSDQLFFQSNEVCIRHQGENYCLRRTRNGKLILTK